MFDGRASGSHEFGSYAAFIYLEWPKRLKATMVLGSREFLMDIEDHARSIRLVFNHAVLPIVAAPVPVPIDAPALPAPVVDSIVTLNE